MGDGPPGFRRNSSCSAVLRIHRALECVMPTGLLPPSVGLSRPFSFTFHRLSVSYNPSRSWFGLFPFRSPLLRESIFLSLPPGTKMFQFPGSTSICAMYSRIGNVLRRWVPPFGYLRFTAYLQLLEAFRCWFRPSSALSAKASTVRSSSLNRNEFVSVL